MWAIDSVITIRRRMQAARECLSLDTLHNEVVHSGIGTDVVQGLVDP
jgi:hypothetical protein